VTTAAGQARIIRWGVTGSVVVIAGILVSGPLMVLLVEVIHPQPKWVDAATWAANFHRVQLLPYHGGIPLIAGCVMQLTALHALAGEEKRPRTAAGLIFAGVWRRRRPGARLLRGVERAGTRRRRSVDLRAATPPLSADVA